MSDRRLLASAVALVLFSVCLPAFADADGPSRRRVGEIAPTSISTPHPYPANTVETWEIHHPGATYVKVKMARFELAPGDRVIVASPDGRERYEFTGRGYKDMGVDFWVNSVLGDRVLLRLESVTGGAYGFDVESYAYGIAPILPGPPNDTESVCGTNEWTDVACYEATYPTEYDRAKRAVVVLYNGTENCTGVKVGCPNQILTNEHCVTSQGEVNVTEVRFEYQNAACNSGPSSFSQSYLGDLFIEDHFTLDYSLITVEGESNDYEAAEIDARLPDVGERLYISGHPAGSPKKLSIEDSESPNGLCRADFSPTDGRGTDTDVGYFCDTTGGSSGSPVWSGVSHKLIALHHFGGCPNSGVRMDLIYPLIEADLTSCCDLPPNVPSLAATPNGDNRIDLTWDDSQLDTVVEYVLSRSRTPGGPYQALATIADTSPGMAAGPGYSYADWDVSGGTTYYYTLESTDGATCTSDPAAEVQATATGDCTLPPIFAGVTSIDEPGLGICTLSLFWDDATPECGASVTYNVYRGSSADFEPGPGNLLAEGVTDTAFVDISQLVDGDTYHYVVRSEDTSNGSEDGNLARISGVPTGQLAGETWADGAGDGGPAALTPDAGWAIDPAGGVAGGAAYVTGAYADDTCAELVSPPLEIGLGSTLTFDSHYDIETSDKGVVELSTDGGSSWQRVPVNYPGSSAATDDACGLASNTYFSGSDAAWTEYTADLSAWQGQVVELRWLLSSGPSGGGGGWWVDNVAVTNVTTQTTCATGSSCPENPFVDVTPEGPLTVCAGDGPTLAAELAGGSGAMTYQWYRDGEPVAGAEGPTHRPEDLGVHAYNVRVRSEHCEDDVFDGLDTQILRVDAPFFDGIDSAVNPKLSTCTVELDWTAAQTVCDGPISYFVYRDTVSPVSPTVENLVASGVAGTSYSDVDGLVHEETYHYLVRAHDGSTGQLDANTVEASAAPDGPNHGLNSWYLETFDPTEDFADWTVTTGPGPHSCGAWALSSSSSFRPSGGSGSFIVADSNCAQIAPRTSASVDSPPIDFDVDNVLGVSVAADVRYTTGDGDDTTIEVWDGTQWVVVWNDPNAGVNTRLEFDVTAYAVGNPAFRVRFNYQNANADGFFAVDDVDVVANVLSVCETAAPGPPSVPDDGLHADLVAPGGGIEVTWDATSCPAADYDLLYGDLASVGSYALLGGQCALGTSGSFTWGSPPPGDLYFVMVGTDGAGTESSWGRDGSLVERNGLTPSGVCGATEKVVGNVCP